jgi:PncC family amidohydrolase
MAGPDERDLGDAALRLGHALRAAGWRLATAESSTGGLIGHAITMIPGSSDYYPGGVISYSNLAKEVELHVAHDLLVEHGAVSAEVAAAMAEGVRDRFGTEIGVGVTGIAGGGAGQADRHALDRHRPARPPDPYRGAGLHPRPGRQQGGRGAARAGAGRG